jgi:hypothetical protein
MFIVVHTMYFYFEMSKLFQMRFIMNITIETIKQKRKEYEMPLVFSL